MLTAFSSTSTHAVWTLQPSIRFKETLREFPGSVLSVSSWSRVSAPCCEERNWNCTFNTRCCSLSLLWTCSLMTYNQRDIIQRIVTEKINLTRSITGADGSHTAVTEIMHLFLPQRRFWYINNKDIKCVLCKQDKNRWTQHPDDIL